MQNTSSYSQIKYILFIIFFCFDSNAYGSEPGNIALIIMGPSCAGKSTLAKMLALPKTHWKIAEIDAIETDLKEKHSDSSETILIKKIIEQADKFLHDGYNVIIDTNIYDEKLNTIQAQHIKKILISCPIDILRQRNATRDNNLKRSGKKAFYALNFVIETAEKFDNPLLISSCDWYFDSSDISADKIYKQLYDQLTNIEAENNNTA